VSAEDDAVEGTGDGLQVELVPPDTERKPGDTNVRKWRFDVHPRVFPVACLMITLFITLTLVFRSQAVIVFDAVQTGIFTTAGWFYILSTNVFIVVIL